MCCNSKLNVALSIFAIPALHTVIVSAQFYLATVRTPFTNSILHTPLWKQVVCLNGLLYTMLNFLVTHSILLPVTNPLQRTPRWKLLYCCLGSLQIIGSAEALPILCVRCTRCVCVCVCVCEREREREKYGSDVAINIVAVKLVMSVHFPLPKNCTWRWIYTFPCQIFALFVSSFTLPISPFLNGHRCGAEIRNEFSLSVAKKIRPLCSDFLMWRDCSSHRKNESN